jgi:hypothetical protein
MGITGYILSETDEIIFGELTLKKNHVNSRYKRNNQSQKGRLLDLQDWFKSVLFIHDKR